MGAVRLVNNRTAKRQAPLCIIKITNQEKKQANRRWIMNDLLYK